jgi:transposase
VLELARGEWIGQSIESAGCRALFLPPYSPIESMWSKVKRRLREAEARTVEALEIEVGTALAAVTSSDCVGWFDHCDYTLQVR